MDSSDDENDFNDQFFDDLRLNNNVVDQRKLQVEVELPEVAQKYAICEFQPSSNNIIETSQADEKNQQFKDFLRDHKKECSEEIPCKIDLKQKVKFIVCDSYS